MSINLHLFGCTSSPSTSTVTVNATPTVTSTNQAICAGNTSTLTATGSTAGGTFNWSNGQTGSSIQVSPTTTTNYTVTYTANGCTSSPATSTVTVNAAPTVTSTNQAICGGNTATLTATGSTAGGTFNWSNGQTGSSIQVSPTTTTNYTVTYTANGCTSSPATSIVTVNPIPVLSGNSVSICSGGTATLAVTSTVTGGNYTWISGQSGNSITVSPTSTSTYTVTQSTNGCTSSPLTLTVTVTAAPSISLTGATACEGSSVNLTPQVSIGGGTYSWNTGQSSPTLTVAPTATTNYTVTYTVSGCAPVTSSAAVTIQPLPTVDLGPDTVVCEYNLPIVLSTQSSTAGAQYSWSTGAISSSIQVNTGGLFSLTANLNGCSDADSILVTVESCASISELENQVKLYPNPTTGIVFLNFNETEDVEIALINSIGQRVKMISGKGEQLQIDISDLSEGMYQFVITLNDRVSRIPLMKLN